MEDAGERVVLAALGDLLELGGLGALLLLGGLGLLLLLLLARRGLVGTCEGAQHGELDGVVVDRVLRRRWFRVDSQRRAVDHRDLFGTNNALCRLSSLPLCWLVVGRRVVCSRRRQQRGRRPRRLQSKYSRGAIFLSASDAKPASFLQIYAIYVKPRCTPRF